MSTRLITHIAIEQCILFLRGHKVMLDKDLAELYGVATKVLNQAIRRNRSRFPEDFMFQLTKAEKEEVVTICDHLVALKFSPQLPYAFTEQGVAMLATVLNSERAIQMNIAIIRAFVKLRETLSLHKELAHKLRDLERVVGKHGREIKMLFEAIRRLMAEPEKPKQKIGFHNN